MLSAIPQWIVDLAAWVGVIAALVTGITVTSKPLSKLGKIIGGFVTDEIGQVVERSVEAKLAPIKAEVEIDSGKSLKDAVIRIEQAVAELTAKMDVVSMRVGNVERQTETIITQELPIITMMAEAIMSEQRHVADGLAKDDG